MSFKQMDENLKKLKKTGEELTGSKAPYKATGEKRSRKQVEAEYWRHQRWVERKKKQYGC